MASDEEVRRRLNEEKIRQDQARREADEASKARIRQQIEEQRRKDK